MTSLSAKLMLTALKPSWSELQTCATIITITVLLNAEIVP